MGHSNPSFSEILQAYQMLSLAPGFLSVGGVLKGFRLPMALRAKLRKKRGRTVCKGAGFPLPIDTDPVARVRQGYADHTSARLKDMVPAMLDSMSPTPMPPPSRTVGHIAEALSDMGLARDVFNATTDALQGVLTEARSPKEAAAVTAQVLQAIPDLSPVDRREVAYRIAFLHSLTAKP